MTTIGVRVWTTIYRRLLLLTRVIDSADAGPALAPLLRCSWIDRDSADLYLALRPETERSEIDRRWRRGHRCSGLWRGAELVHAAWVATGPGPVSVPYFSRELHLEPGDVYFYDTFTAPSQRGQGLATMRDRSNRRELAGGGYWRAVTLVASENAAGLRTVVTSGYRAIGIYRLARLGPCRIERSEAFAAEPMLAMR